MKFFRSMSLIIAATCFFGVAQGAAEWTDLFEWLKDPDFKVTKSYNYQGIWNTLSFSSSSAQADLSAAGNAKLKIFFDTLLEMLKAKDYGFPKQDIRTNLTIQQAENLIKIFKDQKIKNHIIGPKDAEMPNITNSDTKKTYATHLFLESLRSAFTEELAKNTSVDKAKTYVSQELLATIWANADTPSVWEIFFDALKEANFDANTWQQKFSEASRPTLQELFYSFFNKIESQNITWQQIINFNQCLKNQSIQNHITNKIPQISMKNESEAPKLNTKIIIPKISTEFDTQSASKNSTDLVPESLWTDLSKKVFTAQLTADQAELAELQKKLDAANALSPDAQENEIKARGKWQKAIDALKSDSTPTGTPLEKALIALKTKLAHLAYELHRLQDPSIQPTKSAKQLAVDRAQEEFKKAEAVYKPIKKLAKQIDVLNQNITRLNTKLGISSDAPSAYKN